MRKKLDDRSEKCIFIGYSNQSKAYKLYKPETKKVIISRDVEFKEKEAWDGSIDKTISIEIPVPQEDDEVEDQITQGGQQGSQIISLVRSTPIRSPRNSIEGESSNQTTPNYQSSGESYPTIASLKSRKTKSLKELYEGLDVNSYVELFTC